MTSDQHPRAPWEAWDTREKAYYQGIADGQEATARLNAAAPDLLKALQLAHDCLVTEEEFSTGSALDGEIRAALAKAWWES